MRIFRTLSVICVLAILMLSRVAYVQAQNQDGLTMDLQQQMQALQAQMDGLVGNAANANDKPSPSASNVQSGDTNLQRSIYVLNNFLMNDQGTLGKLDELCKIDRQSCSFMSELWRVKALKSCADFNRYVFEDMASLQDDATAQQQQYYRMTIEQCNMAYYQENWDMVVESIDMALTKAKAKAKTK